MKKLPIFEADESELKRYYTIGEVADMFEVSTSLIRFWEGEFAFLKPHKNSKGDRRFTLQNTRHPLGYRLADRPVRHADEAARSSSRTRRE